MKGLFLNVLLGLGLGRFSSVWSLLVLMLLVAGEIAFGIWIHHLNTHACVRRGAALLVCGQVAFLLGALMRPMRGEM